ncbi:GNAT family N-acetyltransferase [Archangium violaceum]|uniref:GNAT family N-acetyltransferase n=1 Tax=Archangium violaceum TaxID=83451 RepID=UPI0019512050|nr:GNAT family protein [Archangium violaceum]QRN95327.1 GNAT family N-acetyltransferase [Archangium violaceum]
MAQPPAYLIRTERLALRCPSPELAALRQAAVEASREALLPWFTWAKDEPRPVAEHVQVLRRLRGRFDLDEDRIYSVLDADEREFLGELALFKRAGEGARELGYWVSSRHAGKGVATEMLSVLSRLAFEVDGLKRLDIQVAVGNEPSAAVARKLGFTLEGTLRQRPRNDGGPPEDTWLFTLLASEYPTSPAARMPVKAYDITGALLFESGRP